VADDLRKLAHQILDFAPTVMRTVSSELRQTDHLLVAVHFRLLWILERHPATLSELAERQLVSLPTMSNSITFLEERGWVARKRSSEDRRRVMIEITPEGREVLVQSRQHMDEKVAQIIGVLSVEEQVKVSEGLSILQGAFNRHMETVNQCSHHDKQEG
jgi:DNA-binding MarR family transcriptional regulator